MGDEVPHAESLSRKTQNMRISTPKQITKT